MPATGTLMMDVFGRSPSLARPDSPHPETQMPAPDDLSARLPVPSPAPRGRRRLATAALALLLLGGAYQAVGFRALLNFRQHGLAYDLRLRWVEMRYVLAGQSPLDVYFASKEGVEQYRLRTGRNAPPRADLGVPHDAGYPPWSYLFGAAAFWPDWPAARVYWAAINAAALAGTALWAASRAGGSRPLAWLLVGSVLACSSDATTLAMGQAGMVMVGLLAGSLAAMERGRDVAAGLLLGLAMFKPTTAAPFLFAALVAGRWRSVLAAGAYLLVACGATWARVGVDPLEMTLQTVRSASLYIGDGTGPVNWLLAAGLSPEAAGRAAALGVFALAATSMLLARRRGPIAMFAIAAVACRLWTYHRSWDDNALIFLLVPLLGLAARGRRAGLWLAAGAVGLSLWLPARLFMPDRFAYTTWTNLLQVVAWVVGAATLCLAVDPATASAPTPGSPRP